MKKLFLVPLLALAINLHAQNNFIGIALGINYPQSSFAKIDNYQADGFAQSSFSLSFDGAYYPIPIIGAAGSFNFSTNYVDATALEEGIKAILPAPIPANAEFEFDLGQWTFVNLMVGPQLSAPLGPLTIDIRALGGIRYVMPPRLEYTVTYTNSTYYSKNTNRDLTLGYTLGAGLRWSMGGASLRVAADYYTTNGKFEMEKEWTDNGTPADPGEERFEIPVKNITLSIGLAYHF
jgi:hypothetical protein